MSDCISRQAVNEIINDIRDCISVEGYWAILERMKKLPPVTPKGLDNILREIEIEETLSDDKPNTAWAIGYKQGLQTVRRIVERYKEGV